MQKTDYHLGLAVRIAGFKTRGDISDSQASSYERDYIDGLFARHGHIESIDIDPRHPITVYFGEKTNPRRCRFSEAELIAR